MGANVAAVPTSTVADGDSDGSAQVDHTDQASSRTHDTGRAFKGNASARRRLADVRSEYDGGWSAMSGTEDEDPAEYFEGHEGAGELLDPLVDNPEGEEARKAKLKELDRLAELGVYKSVDLHVALGKKRASRSHIAHSQQT